jgi:class 3 adenylate cyclase
VNVHAAAPVMELADPAEVLVSSAVRKAFADTDVQFTDRGCHTLKGLTGVWRLYAVGSIQ